MAETELILNQWKEKGWVWAENSELDKVLDILRGIESILFLKPTSNGYFILKSY